MNERRMNARKYRRILSKHPKICKQPLNELNFEFGEKKAAKQSNSNYFLSVFECQYTTYNIFIALYIVSHRLFIHLFLKHHGFKMKTLVFAFIFLSIQARKAFRIPTLNSRVVLLFCLWFVYCTHSTLAFTSTVMNAPFAMRMFSIFAYMLFDII